MRTLLVGKTNRYSGGYSLPIVLVGLMTLSIFANVASIRESYRVKSERERELLYRGQAYMRAIGRFYLAGKDAKIYPRSLQDLLKDPRFAYRRHIRRLYEDPVAGGEWRILRQGRGIIGVASISNDKPLRRGNFPIGLEHFAGTTSYSQWLFEFHPQKIPPKITSKTRKTDNK